MEGASLLQVMRLLYDQPLYTQPSLDYIPLIYPPVYFYVSALAAKLLGLGFTALRLVSALAFLGCLVLIFQSIHSVTQNLFSALVGVGFFAATYPLSGIWFDVARVDTLFVFFCLTAIWFSSRNSVSDIVFSGLFWTLAVFTKQTALLPLVCCYTYLLLTDFQRNYIRAAVTGLLGVTVFAVCIWQWGEWFYYFVFYLPIFHESQDQLSDILYSLSQLILPVLLAMLISTSPFVLDRRLWQSHEHRRYYGFMTCVMFGLSFAGRLNLGGYTNVYLPAHAMLAVMLGLGLDWWRTRLQTSAPQRANLFKSVVYIFCLVQFLSTSYDPRWVIPTKSYEESWSRMESVIAASDGTVLFPELNYLAAFANKPALVNAVALEEIVGEFGDPEPVQSSLLHEQIQRAFREQQFGLVLLKDLEGPWQAATDAYHCTLFSEWTHTRDLPSALMQEYYVCSPE